MNKKSKSIYNSIIPRKRFGQHFLTDQNILNHIVNAIAPKMGEKIVEIGPGLGALTQKLLSYSGELDVIELDRDLIPHLQQLNSNKLHIHQADALQFDFATLTNVTNQKLRIVGNLPYNISTPLLFHLLEYQTIIQDMHFLLQKEVAERIAAPPGTSTYGQLSVMTQYHCATEILFFINPQAFYPRPKVDSALIKLIPRKPHLQAKNLAQLRSVVRLAFSKRRKMLRNSFKDVVPLDAIASLGIDLKKRPEELTVDDFVKISNIV